MSTDATGLSTHLGHAGWDDHEVRGQIVFDLDPQTTSLVDLALLTLGINVDRDLAHRVITICAQAALNPDPRIPPMKLVRLGSAYGSPSVALAAAFVGMNHSFLGMTALDSATEFFTELASNVGHNPTQQALDRALERVSQASLYGFGVPGRPTDERVPWLRKTLGPLPFPTRVWNDFYSHLERYFEPHRRRPNAVGVAACALLDLGCSIDQIGALGFLYMLLPLLGNAHEGAQQRPEQLRRLPISLVDYVGPPARQSPRAIQALDSSSPKRPPTGPDSTPIDAQTDTSTGTDIDLG